MRAGYQETSLHVLAHNITEIEVNHTDDREVHLEKDQFKIRRIDQPSRDHKKRNVNKLKKNLKSKPHSSHWIFTPSEVLRLQTETLVQRLLTYYENEGDVDTFLRHLRMMKAIYNADCFDLGDRKIQGYYLGEALLKIFKYTTVWTEQMFLAYEEFNYFFNKQTKKSLQIIRKNEKKRQARAQVAEVLHEETTDELNSVEAEAVTVGETDPETPPKWNKKQRQLLNSLKKQRQQPKGYGNQYFNI